eukprot:gene1687-1050_t
MAPTDHTQEGASIGKCSAPIQSVVSASFISIDDRKWITQPLSDTKSRSRYYYENGTTITTTIKIK